MSLTRRHLLSLPAAGLAYAQQPPTDLDIRRVSIISEGTRMHGVTFALKSQAGKKLPTILMAHGWGGTAAALRPDAVLFARAGFLAVTFDYRGWGESDSRLVLAGPAPKEKADGKFTAEVTEVREVVDPLDFGTDWLNAIHWLHGEPMCDTARIALWGSSFSGGLVVWAAARDPRVKVVHSQVGSFDGRWVVVNDAARKVTAAEATALARGERQYPAPGVKTVGNLKGAPARSRFVDFAPVDDVTRIAKTCAIQIVIAENEELFDNKEHGILAHARFQGTKKLVVVPKIKHYGIYNEARAEAQKLALDWFKDHL